MMKVMGAGQVGQIGQNINVPFSCDRTSRGEGWDNWDKVRTLSPLKGGGPFVPCPVPGFSAPASFERKEPRVLGPGKAAVVLA